MPILLVQKDGISEDVRMQLAALKPGKIFIIGLEGAISRAVANQAAQITRLNEENIVRIGGVDRYATSLAVAEYFGGESRTVCLATGDKFPDALAGTVYAAKNKAVLILTGGSLPAGTADYIKGRKPAAAAVFGGEAAVGKDVEELLRQSLKP